MKKTVTKKQSSKVNSAKASVKPSGRRKSASGFTGVYRVLGGKMGWKAVVRVMGYERYLGVYETPEKAARAYNQAYKASYGKSAYKVPVVKK
jgi:hypothetical protein